MGRFTIDPTQYVWAEDKSGTRVRTLSQSDYARFNLDLLGLGNVLEPAESIDAIAAVFDLQGFTTLCGQIDPQLTVPIYLNEFLTWLMQTLRERMKHSEVGDRIGVWCPLPFYVKFLGDGILVLWNANSSDPGRRNVIITCHDICALYRTKFLPSVAGKVVEPPRALRCGIARGSVLSVGGGADYVGSCINIAARVQKLPGTLFAFHPRGFNLQGEDVAKFFTEEVVVKQIPIRGIGERELVCILRKEAEALSPKDKRFYKDVV